MATMKIKTGHCPDCYSKRAKIVAQHVREDFDCCPPAVTYYRVLKCRGCSTLYFQSARSNPEKNYYHVDTETGQEVVENFEIIHHWPPAAKHPPPKWSKEIRFKDEILGSLFDNVYKALDNDLGVLAAIGMRVVFDRASELLGINTAKSFKDKLQSLKADNRITDKDRKILQSLIDAGNAAAHGRWQPTSRELDAMVTILEEFLHRAFLCEKIGEKLEKAVPKKNQRRQGIHPVQATLSANKDSRG